MTTLYVRTTGQTLVYPYVPSVALRQDFPNVSFPSEPAADLLANYGVYAVQATTTPAHDPLQQDLVELPPVRVGNTWTQQWQVVAVAPEIATERMNTWRAGLVCSPAQCRLALLNAGLLDTVEDWIAAQTRTTQIEYASRTEWRRTWPLVVSAGAAFGLTDTDLDAIFVQAQLL